MSDDSLTLTVQVSARAAILAGKTVTGKRTIAISADDLARLPVELREEIAIAYESGVPVGGEPTDPPVVEPRLYAILPVLEARASARKMLVEADRKAAARRAEETAANGRANAAKDAARAKALRDWVERNGDETQKKRLKEGFLPEEEILDEIVDDLIPMHDFQVYVPMHKGEVCECACAGSVVFETRGVQLDMIQFKKLEEIREQLPEGAVAEPVERRGTCPKCRCLPTARVTVRIALPWEGWLLRREFLLK